MFKIKLKKRKPDEKSKKKYSFKRELAINVLHKKQCKKTSIREKLFKGERSLK